MKPRPAPVRTVTRDLVVGGGGLECIRQTREQRLIEGVELGRPIHGDQADMLDVPDEDDILGGVVRHGWVCCETIDIRPPD